MKLPRVKMLRVGKRTKIRFGPYKNGKVRYFRVWSLGFYLA